MSVRMFVLGALTAAAAFPAGLVAQERQSVSRPRIFIDGDSLEFGRDRFRAITQRRARLGLTVKILASDTDSIGATIEAVLPGGPAAKAGIRSGDIITKIDGKSLSATDNSRAGEDESLPGMRLVEYASQLKPEQTIRLEYLRAGVRKTSSLVTGNEPLTFMESFGDGGDFTITSPRIQIQRMPGVGGGGRILEAGPGFTGYAYAFGGPLMDLEVAPLNADLGAYFGTTEGVLVINVPKDSPLGVKGGDVILNVDGRKATGPGSFLRILRSYEPGDSFKLEIMRNKSRTTVTGTLEKPSREQ